MLEQLVYFMLLLSFGGVSARISVPDRIEILGIFNKARATTIVPAANMKMMVWDAAMEDQAQAYSENCGNGTQLNGINQNPPSFLAYQDRGLGPVAIAIFRTLRMAPWFDYDTGGCIGTKESMKNCQHPEAYANICLASNERIGCGVSICGVHPNGKYKLFHACVVAQTLDQPSDNGKPWIAGPRCSQCPSAFPYCIDDALCSEQPSTLKPTNSPTLPTLSPTSATPTRFPTILHAKNHSSPSRKG